MNRSVVLNILGRLLYVMAGCLTVPALVGLGYPDAQSVSRLEPVWGLDAVARQLAPYLPTGTALDSAAPIAPTSLAGELLAFIVSIALCLIVGFALKRRFPAGADLGAREGFGIVTLGWILLTAFGALPFWLSGAVSGYTDAFFEIMSGFTTTGSTIITNSEALPNAIESLPNGLLFWRSMTHWLGGMGIVVLAIAILPTLGAGGFQLFKSEVPGPTADKLSPRVKETAKLLWYVYAGLTVLQIGALYLVDDQARDWRQGLFDSVCHTFGTLATGGFATKNASIAHYADLRYHWVIIAFMFAAGTNFGLHWLVLRGYVSQVFRNLEFRVYALIIAVVTVILALGVHQSWREADALRLERANAPAGPPPASPDAEHALRWADDPAERQNRYDDPSAAFTSGAFQTVSILTTTGFCTANYDYWPAYTQAILVILMFIGGCAGSTGGGMKVQRVMVLFKLGMRELAQLIHPRQVIRVKIREETVSNQLAGNIGAFFILYLGLFVIGGVTLAVFGLPLKEALMAVVACIGNIGPGLGKVGAVGNYAWIPDAGKWLLSLCMLLGRLEIYSVLVLFMPGAWRR